MFMSETNITLPNDFNTRFIKNLTYNISELKSSLYITTLDKNVNAKSRLGLLGLGLKKDSKVRICACNPYNQEQANMDLSVFYNYIVGDAND